MINELRNKFFDSLDTTPASHPHKSCSLTEVRKVCVILTSPRGGSSVFTKDMKNISNTMHLQGEETPFYEAAGWNDFLNQELQPRVNVTDTNYRQFARDMLYDMGTINTGNFNSRHYAEQIVSRMIFQLPDLFKVNNITVDVMQRLIDVIAANAEARQKEGVFNPEDFYIDVFVKLDGFIRGLKTKLGYYDINENKLAGIVPKSTLVGATPANQILAEEAPFVLSEPMNPVSSEDLASKTLVIKNPTNSFRMDFIQSLYPSAQIKVIHLTRNPAAAMNGLYDGWQHRGFYSFVLKRPLNTSDYKQRRYWSFDMPPNYQECYNTTELMDICLFQWAAAHKHILRYKRIAAANMNIQYHTVRFEDYIQNRTSVMNSVAQWLGGSLTNSIEVGNVMSTSAPQLARWQKDPARRAKILETLERGAPSIPKHEVDDVIRELGYNGGVDTWV